MKGDPPNAYQFDFTDDQWRSLDLPHDLLRHAALLIAQIPRDLGSDQSAGMIAGARGLSRTGKSQCKVQNGK